MKSITILLLFLPALMISCKNQEVSVVRIEGKQVQIADSIPADSAIDAFVAPYRKHIDKAMDSVLAFAPEHLDKKNGDLNTAIGNMMADAVMELAGPVFKSRTGKAIDIVLLNYGGIRATINEGPVTTRTAYQIMPFENEVVVSELKGKHLTEMINYLVQAQTAHPVSGIELKINKNNQIIYALVQGKPIDVESSYYVATNDYLYQGGDNMTFFSKAENVTKLDYKIRNLLIDYFKKKDTLAPVIDQRFIRS